MEINMIIEFKCFGLYITLKEENVNRTTEVTEGFDIGPFDLFFLIQFGIIG